MEVVCDSLQNMRASLERGRRIYKQLVVQCKCKLFSLSHFLTDFMGGTHSSCCPCLLLLGLPANALRHIVEQSSPFPFLFSASEYLGHFPGRCQASPELLSCMGRSCFFLCHTVLPPPSLRYPSILLLYSATPGYMS